MWRHVDLVWTDVSEERIAHAGSSLADFSTLKMDAIRSSETSVHTRSTRRHNPEDVILQSSMKSVNESYILLRIFTYLLMTRGASKGLSSTVKNSDSDRAMDVGPSIS
jgi:hypothetical protein